MEGAYFSYSNTITLVAPNNNIVKIPLMATKLFAELWYFNFFVGPQSVYEKRVRNFKQQCRTNSLIVKVNVIRYNFLNIGNKL